MKEETKVCSVCGRTLPISAFSKSYKGRCKECVAKQTKEKRKIMSQITNDSTKTKDIDWEQRRYEIAKEALARLIETNTSEVRCVVYANGERNVVTYRNQPEAAVWYADALICALKNKA